MNATPVVSPRGVRTATETETIERKGGIIYITFPPTTGTMGSQLLASLLDEGIRVNGFLECDIVRLKRTWNMTYTVAIIPGAILKSGELRIETFLDKADSLKFDQLNLEAICMLRRLVTPRIMATFELDEIEVYGYFGYPSNLIILGEERNQPNLCIGYSDPRRLSSPTTGMAFLSGAMKDPGLLP